MNCRLWVMARIFRLNFIIRVMNKILQSHMFTKTWMWNGRILCFVALNIATNLSDHLCSAEASTNGEFHLHNAKRKQYSSILHSLSHKLWNCNILNKHSIEIQAENPSIHVTNGRTQRWNSGRCAFYHRRITWHWERLHFVATFLYRYSSHNREFHNEIWQILWCDSQCWLGMYKRPLTSHSQRKWKKNGTDKYDFLCEPWR